MTRRDLRSYSFYRSYCLPKRATLHASDGQLCRVETLLRNVSGSANDSGSRSQAASLHAAYCNGSETCSCTIIHFPSWFSHTSVQRNVAISCLPFFMTASSATVALPHAMSP
jgi:hypothetical protein